jgi:hypothetical protein
MAEIPFEQREGLIWTAVTVPQSPQPLNFLVDTGAGVSTLSLQTSKRLGLKLGERVQVRGVEASTTGYWPQQISAKAGAVVLPVEYLAVDLCALSKACNCEVDGLLGADFFADRVVQIDFDARKIRVLKEREDAAAGEVQLPLRLSRRSMQVPVGVNGQQPVWMRLDTGCAAALHWVSNGARTDEASPRVSIGLSRIDGAEILTTVKLGTEKLVSIPTGLHKKPFFANERGLLGNGILTRFSRVTLDPMAGVLLLDRRD